jgi:hypothetical protein
MGVPGLTQKDITSGIESSLSDLNYSCYAPSLVDNSPLSSFLLGGGREKA